MELNLLTHNLFKQSIAPISKYFSFEETRQPFKRFPNKEFLNILRMIKIPPLDARLKEQLTL